MLAYHAIVDYFYKTSAKATDTFQAVLETRLASRLRLLDCQQQRGRGLPYLTMPRYRVPVHLL